MGKILITSALPYANGPLHFGHIAGAYLPGDCYSRYQRMCGNDVLFICGSDEYGIAITLTAEMEKRSPQEHVDIFHSVNKNFFEQLDIDFDHYSRTTWEGHKAPVVEFFQDLNKNGYIEERVTDHLYSEEDNRFLADRYVVGTCPHCSYEEARGDECTRCGASYESTDLKNPRSKLSNAPLSLKPTRHWFLRFDKFKDRLAEWVKDKPHWKSSVINFAKKYFADVRPRAITRDSEWGIPVPLGHADGKVFYVWFDAPIGYISASMEWAEKKKKDPEAWKEFWYDKETKYVQFIGKDNIPFHAVFFPAMIMGQDKPYKTVDHLSANDFYNLEGKAFSKSDGWYVDLENFFKKYTTDQIRYAIAATAPETSDSEFRWKDFQKHCNAELLGKYGNFINRTLVFAQNHCEGAVPGLHHLEDEDKVFLDDIRTIVAEASQSYEACKMRKASQQIMELAQRGNVYFDLKKPWVDAKDASKRERLLATIGCCIQCLKAMALISYPIIPTSAEKLWKMLGYEKKITEQHWNDCAIEHVPEGQKLPKAKVLFKKIEDKEIEEEIQSLQKILEKRKEEDKKRKPSYAPLKATIEYGDFDKVDLRIGDILEAEAVPKSKKLLKLKVNIGIEKRTVIAGISQHYAPGDLIGKKVVVVANLKPAKLMGVESQGMILAGSLDKALELATVVNLPAGSSVA
jgi:methionyl-tRNA synthetase